MWGGRHPDPPGQLKLSWLWFKHKFSVTPVSPQERDRPGTAEPNTDQDSPLAASPPSETLTHL